MTFIKEKKTAIYRIVSVLVLLLASGILTVCSLMYSTNDFADWMFESYFTSPRIFLMNYIPMLLLMTFTWFVFSRLWASFFVTFSFMMIMSWINMYKMIYRDDPMVFADLRLVKELEGMGMNYNPEISSSQLVIIACVIAVTAAFFIAEHFYFRCLKRERIEAEKLLVPASPSEAELAEQKSLRRRRILRVVAVHLAGAMVCVLCSGLYISKVIDKNFYSSITNYYAVENGISQFSANQVYISKGFIFPFLHSIDSVVRDRPEGYSDKYAQELLSVYSDDDIPEDQQVNVIAIMLEAFQDFSKYDGIEWESDPYDIYKEIKEESYTGHLITNIFGGGTENTERCFVTGYADYGDLKTPTMSYARYFKSQGYTVEAAHASDGWFYDRLTIDANLGFEQLYCKENRYDEMVGGIAWDGTFIPDIYNLYHQAIDDSDDPYFSFSVTYQNHGPYSDADSDYYTEYVSDEYPKSERNIANNYLTGIHSTSVQLRNLMDKLEEDKEPCVLVFFGDHNPWFGDGNSGYEAFGMNIDTSTTEGFLNYYETDYVIWANSAAKKVLDNDFEGQGPDIGPYYLMNVLFDLCGWEGSSYTKLCREMMDITPIMHSGGWYMENEKLVGSMSDSGQDALNRYKIVQKYMRDRVQQTYRGNLQGK